MSLGTDYIFMVLMTSLMAKNFVRMIMSYGQHQSMIWLIGDMKESSIKRHRISIMQTEQRRCMHRMWQEVQMENTISTTALQMIIKSEWQCVTVRLGNINF